MKYLSICSGIEAATMAWHPLGWTPVAFAEIEKFPSAVLAHHYPDIPNLGDMTEIDGAAYKGVDILVGGTPCQAFSVAGLRKSLADDRGNLSLIFVELADAINPGFVVWENVPGVLSTEDNAFGCFLGALAGAGCALQPAGERWTDAGAVLGPRRAIAWRCLDAQYFGLAQRRKRVFVVACPRDGADPAEVLFEREGVRRDSAPSREEGEGVTSCLAPGSGGRSGHGYQQRGNEGDLIPETAPTIAARTRGGGGLGTDAECDGALIPQAVDLQNVTVGEASPTLQGEAQKRGNVGAAVLAFNARQDPDSWEDRAEPVDTNGQTQAVAFSLRSDASRSGEAKKPSPDADGRMRKRDAGFNVETERVPTIDAGAPHTVAFTISDNANAFAWERDQMPTIPASAHHESSHQLSGIRQGMQVRRLTPRECERLQGFPDDFTRIPWRGKEPSDCPDGPRYRALGNSMATPVMHWIGCRIERIASCAKS